MKISFPHMGNMHIPIESSLKLLGADVITPPYNSKKTLSLGTRHSSEVVCLPYKLILGNFLEAIEMGAESLIMIDCLGICRLGQYSNSIRDTLKDLGHDVKFENFELYNSGALEIFTKFQTLTGNKNPIDLIRALRLLLLKIDLLDNLEKSLSYYRAREMTPGDAEKNYKKGLLAFSNAIAINETKEAYNNALRLIASTKIDENKEVVNIDLTGEIFVVLDSFSNLDVEKELGKMGVQVNRKINISNWSNSYLKPALLRSEEPHGERAKRNAKDFLHRDVGGDAIESVGDASFAGDNNNDGIIHLLPFTCMPEIVAQNIMPNISKTKDIPVLSLVLDEQMGKAGYITRLEAFVDLVKRKKRLKAAAS